MSEHSSDDSDTPPVPKKETTKAPVNKIDPFLTAPPVEIKETGAPTFDFVRFQICRFPVDSSLSGDQVAMVENILASLTEAWRRDAINAARISRLEEIQAALIGDTRSFAPGYVFEDEIQKELKLHPLSHSHFDPVDLRTQLQCVPP